MSNQGLFDEFPEVSAKQWKQKIQFDLKGADYNETLLWESLEGIKVKPFYHAEDLESLKTFHLAKEHHWKIAQSIYVGDSKLANNKALDCLKRGAQSILFTIPDNGVNFKDLLLNINLEQAALHFNFKLLESEQIESLLKFLDGKKHNIHLNIDLIGNLARTGNWFHSLEKDHSQLEKICSSTSTQKEINTIGVDISLYQNAGANMVQQLAYGLAHANEYLNHFANLHASDAENHIPVTFKVSVGSNYFFEIAKLRALRWLWKSLAQVYGIKSDCHILAMPTKRNKTLYDYNVNMLRTTSECMSSILGGADTVCNLSYDAIYHKDNEFGERIARNQLVLLKEESYFDQASQAAEGNYYVESLTNQLAEKALALFKQIESSGGFLSELKNGTIQRKIKESALKEKEFFDKKELTLIGTNQHQNGLDKMKDDLELYPFVKIKPRKTVIEPIIESRLAEELEQKRLSDE
ncbi:methylmalonyl-CoA mutase [Flagellimonas hymeniacidonis]|uniref:Methylmalonyl-CoA mutase n=1 Tax=Flagellimonas hymeniacidonis TaxID=2603628 RepID=A0A5C8V3W9_9FLAO|nr:methylmalonyl-CoA mutase subunit beta [Flagellimonas hymeniacidonis]TXN35187.1 methylmalonyl-CoA mutase [Flagellimonas hymeniacidonis]